MSRYMAAIKRITIYGNSQYMATINYKKDYYFSQKKKKFTIEYLLLNHGITYRAENVL